jgi:thiamine biosynthesis lipoprotein
VKTSFERGAPHRFSLNGETMGGRYTAVFYGPAGTDLALIGADLFAAVDQVDRHMSTWNRDSDLCRLNRAPEQAWMAVPMDLAEVLEAALQVGLDSDGAFDVGVGELVDAWGFGPAPRCADAPALAGEEGAFRPAFARLEVDRAGARVRKHAPIAIDLSAIAKGYGVDQLARCLDGHGIANYLVGIDGEMRARGQARGRRLGRGAGKAQRRCARGGRRHGIAR